MSFGGHPKQEKIRGTLEMQFEPARWAVALPMLFGAAGNRRKPGWITAAHPVVNDHKTSAAFQILIQYGPFGGVYIRDVGGIVDQNIRL